jgi:hypothetical protein
MKRLPSWALRWIADAAEHLADLVTGEDLETPGKLGGRLYSIADAALAELRVRGEKAREGRAKQ